ncbi:MAG: hypothetical protein QG629_618 [Patescibacteria group bacterium]|nr:hypothetical protein [Candidatus Saccharibacteria bacterium]MDQ5963536.1 hypothetical protein [Patescibacteria group bacterium]
MKTILVYGDSNTWGQNESSERYPYQVRWVNQLTAKLGSEYCVIPAGLSGRVAGSHEVVEPQKRGKDSFEVVYKQAFPLDVLIVALGSNDIKEKYDLTSEQITADLLWYAESLQEATDYTGQPVRPLVLFVAPPNFVYSQNGFTGDEQKRQAVISGLTEAGQEVVVANSIGLSEDGVHFSPKGHDQMAMKVYEKLKEMGV